MDNRKNVCTRAAVLALWVGAGLVFIVGLLLWPFAWILTGRNPIFNLARTVAEKAESVWACYTLNQKAATVAPTVIA